VGKADQKEAELPNDPDPVAPPPPTLQGAGEVSPTSRKPASTLAELVLSDLGAARPSVTLAEVGPDPSASNEKPAPRGATPTLGTPAVSQRFVGARSPSGRYAAARPAPIFSTPPSESSLFGGSPISEQSLDEVILSYLAEDLEGGPEK
jgi:hypothetical protein